MFILTKLYVNQLINQLNYLVISILSYRQESWEKDLKSNIERQGDKANQGTSYETRCFAQRCGRIPDQGPNKDENPDG